MNWIQIQGFFVTSWPLSIKAVKEEKEGFGFITITIIISKLLLSLSLLCKI